VTGVPEGAPVDKRRKDMKKLLHIKASPRERSYSSKVADAFKEAFKEANPASTIEVLDVFSEQLPTFDGLALDAKYAILHGGQPDDSQKKAWSDVEKLIERFKDADAYLFSLPMWNFGIPYRLKQLIDVITQPGYTFSFTPEEGYKGLVTGKKAVAVYARGGEYPEGTPGEAADFQKRYMDLLLGFIGITDVTSILIEPTLAGGPDGAQAALDKALEAARKAAPGL